MLRRKAMDELVAWKSEPERKCLLIKGQRGVGKTTIVREFAKTYDHSVRFDLSADGRARGIFDGNLDVDRMVDAMRILSPGSELPPGSTLIVLDGIQRCPRARTALKSFTEDGRYDVIAIGSFTDIRLRNVEWGPADLVPVGYESQIRMRGMDFEEFLWAVGYDEERTAELRRAVRGREPLSETALRVYSDRFAEFVTTGGMPEAVAAFASGEGIGRVSRILEDAVRTFRNDAMDLAPESEALKVLKCFDSVPRQLAGTNKKFMWSRIDPGGPGSDSGARTYSDALDWLIGTGMIDPCHRLRGIAAPLRIRKEPSRFKAYMSDTGMLVCMMGPDALRAAHSKDWGFARGALAENAVAECLTKAGIEPNCYIERRGPGRMDLDFVVGLGLETAAIEVGTGRSREAPSLSKTLGDGRFQRRIVFEESNIRVDEDGIEHYPLFAAAFINDIAEPLPKIDL